MTSTDPLVLFDQWFAEARNSEPNDPEAMALATATADGRPSVRMVLMKAFGPEGVSFFTNLDSRKGAELAANPRAALLFHWKSLRRQVRFEGPVRQLPEADVHAYFATRARESQLGAWASDQSRPLDARETFEARYHELGGRFEGKPIPCPPHWGGFRLEPEMVEFWNDRPFRLHERRLFTRAAAGWTEGLLYP